MTTTAVILAALALAVWFAAGLALGLMLDRRERVRLKAKCADLVRECRQAEERERRAAVRADRLEEIVNGRAADRRRRERRDALFGTEN